jgi:DUF4097 and DUF4098 domain-containing protein YvlB
MKKASRIAIATGLALFLIGFAWSGFNFRNIEDDIQHISQKDHESKRATFEASSIKTVKVTIDNVKVVIRQQADPASKQITVDYFQSDIDKFTVAKQNGALIVSRSRDKQASEHFFCLLRCAGGNAAIVVSVPKTSMFAYELQADNAPIHFENADTLQAESINLVASNGSVRLQHITARGVLDIHNDNGSIAIKDVTTSNRLSLNSSNGSNELTDVQAQAITSITDNGSATLRNVTTNDLSVNTSNASITLDRLVATNTTLTSDNGGIRGSLAGSKDDYGIKIGSDNGSVRLDGASYDSAYVSDNATAAKRLTIQSSNASVDITFER